MSKKECITIEGVEYYRKEQLGQGGAGAVFRAETNDGNECALKQVKVSSEFIDAEKSGREPRCSKEKRFLREIKFCLEDHSPRIIKISGYAVCGSGENAHLYYAMPLCAGSLSSVMRGGVDVELAFRYSEQLLEALEVVHSKEVIHRDVKPDNLLIDENQDLILADFGIAHFAESPSLTRKGDILSNRDYLAPEQRKGRDARDVGQAADIFAAGLIINELFTSVRPNGPEYDLVYDVHPRLYEVDELVSMMTQVSSEARIDASKSLAFLRRIASKDRQLKVRVRKEIKRSSPNISERMIEQAVEDVLDGFALLSRGDLGDLGRYNLKYHCNIYYAVLPQLKNLCFLLRLRELCRDMFFGEAVDCQAGDWFEERRGNETKGQCEKLDEILDAHKVVFYDDNLKHLIGEIRKYFLALNDSHRNGIIDDERCKKLLGLSLIDHPILELCHGLQRNGFLQAQKLDSDIDVFTLFVKNLKIVESRSELIEEYSGVFPSEQLGELAARDYAARSNDQVLNGFQEKFPDVQTIPRGRECFSVLFSSYKSYLNFKKKSLAAAKGDYHLENAIPDKLKPSIPFSNGEVVEVRIDNYVVRKVIARILDIMDD